MPPEDIFGNIDICPKCGKIWNDEEIFFDKCFRCGYPESFEVIENTFENDEDYEDDEDEWEG